MKNSGNGVLGSLTIDERKEREGRSNGLLSSLGAVSLAMMILGLSGCATGPYTYNEGSTSVELFQSSERAEKLSTDAVALYVSPSSLSSTTIIKPNQAFSVRLISAFICDFRESSNPFDGLARGNKGANKCKGGNGGQQSGTRGEIAIVANVGERSGTTGLTFDPSEIQNGRVIYYNEDVRETGQLINAKNLPVYGPITYGGNPIYMDWSVLELDNKENAAARQLLKQLASLGSAVAAPYTPVLQLLNSLGGALIAANGDDLEMRYQLEADSYFDCNDASHDGCAKEVVSRMPLREGYYAFIRSENRSEDFDLSQIRICSDHANICSVAAPNESIWRNRTWLLVRIAREDKNAALAQDVAQRLGGLMSSLEKNGTMISEDTLKAIPANIESVLDDLIKKRNKY